MVTRIETGVSARRMLAVLVALPGLLLAAAAAQAAPSPDGLTGVVRAPSAYVAISSSTYLRDGEMGASFTYPVFKMLEAGLTRDRGEFALHTKLQLLPDAAGTPLPALAMGVRDIDERMGKREYFWVASKTFESLGCTLHAGLRRETGFFAGNKSTFGGIEIPLFSVVRLKADYDWGRRTGSPGIELNLGRVTVYDYVLDLIGNRTPSTNLIGLSYQETF